jgi:putative transposase
MPCGRRAACGGASPPGRRIDWRAVRVDFGCVLRLFTVISSEMPHPPGSPHPRRKRPVHFVPVEKGNAAVIVFLTVVSWQRQRIFASDQIHDLLCKCWDDADHWRVGRYIILPDHLHLFCSPNLWPPSSLKHWVAFWKRKVTRNWPTATNGDIWHPNFWDTQLRCGESYTEKWEYVRQNPVRHRLVTHPEDWPYQGEATTLFWQEP